MVKACYVHIPFCDNICHYCDFHRSIYNSETVDKWLTVLSDEVSSKDITKNLETLYVGGGTPTSLNELQLEQFCSMFDDYTKDIKEYTFESNLESIDENKLDILVHHGVNRISLGVQSYDDELLLFMNRKHKKEDINEIIQMISNKIENISIDLMYGFYNQSFESWKDTLCLAVSNSNIKHISLYSLTIEENSVFSKKQIPTIENELEANMYEYAIQYLEKHGFHQYEVANFARDGYESKHNKHYWKYDDFYGVGVGASGKQDHKRYSNDFTIQEYFSNKGKQTIEYLTKKDEVFEYIMMNSRLRAGLDINHFNILFELDFEKLFKDIIEKLLNDEDAYIENNSFVITRKGNMYLHDILVQFLEVLDEREDIK